LIGYFLGGFVAGEGSFTTKAQSPYLDGSARKKFVLCVTVAQHDRPLLEALRAFLGRGSVRDDAPRGSWLPTSTFDIASRAAHRDVTIPFAERFLLPCAKRQQFERWRADLASYEELHPSRYGRGPSECRIEGCTSPVRGQGLCRRHYYAATGY
jgi:hypothetical protein